MRTGRRARITLFTLSFFSPQLLTEHCQVLKRSSQVGVIQSIAHLLFVSNLDLRVPLLINCVLVAIQSELEGHLRIERVLNHFIHKLLQRKLIVLFLLGCQL
jgi:hypothetical protein